MRKLDLIRIVAKVAEMKVPDAHAAVNAVIEVIVRAVASGDVVSIRGFGEFVPSRRVGIVRMNPLTGRQNHAYDHITMIFKSHAALRRRLNGRPASGKEKT